MNEYPFTGSTPEVHSSSEPLAARHRPQPRMDGTSRDLVVLSLAEDARALRLRDVTMIARAGMGHLGSDLSALDILATLYGAVLRIDPSDPTEPERDRFVLSKGHSSGALYVTLAHYGFFDPTLLDSFMAPLSALNGHPRKAALPGLEASTGPLGHGLPIAVGMAIAGKLDGSDRRVYCLLGDGELQEGSNWEALMLAGHMGLDNLTAIIDRNGLQQGSRTEDTNGLEPLADKARAFRWSVVDVDGHDHGAMLDVFQSLPLERNHPSFVVAHTIKGRGVSFMENRVEWHHRVPTPEEVGRALAELEATP